MEEDRVRREPTRSGTTGSAAGSSAEPRGPRVRGAGEPARAAPLRRRRTSRRPPGHQGGAGRERAGTGGRRRPLRQPDRRPHMLGAAIAELVGTFILVFGGTAVAVGAVLSRPTAGGATTPWPWRWPSGWPWRSWWPPWGTSPGRTSTRPSPWGWPPRASSPGATPPIYVAAQLAGAVLAALATWLTFGGAGARSEASLRPPTPRGGWATCRPSSWRSSSPSSWSSW
jgi:hypothetical protein